MSEPKTCEYATDHFAAHRCGEPPSGVTRDVDGRRRYVCPKHAAALVARGLAVRLVRVTP